MKYLINDNNELCNVYAIEIIYGISYYLYLYFLLYRCVNECLFPVTLKNVASSYNIK